MKERNTDASPKGESKIVERCNAHKGSFMLICAGLILFMLLMLFFAMRAWGIHTMEHYGYYQAMQGYSIAGRSSFAPFDAKGPVVTVIQDPEIEGCEQMVVTTASYYTGREMGGSSHYTIETEEGYFYRFENEKLAQSFLANMGEQEGRNRYALKKYVFDSPIYVDDGEREERAWSSRKEAINACKSLTLGEVVYRLFVAFDVKSGSTH